MSSFPDFATMARKSSNNDGVQVFSRYAVDGGNWGIKYCDPNGKVGILPSFVTDLQTYQQVKYGDRTVLVEYHKGIDSLSGSRFVVGDAAKNLGACGTYMTDKAELSPKLVLAAIAPEKGVEKVVVKTLVVCTPNDLIEERVNTLKDLLTGTHHVTRNGVSLQVEIKGVEVVDEVDGTYRLAIAQQIYRKMDRLNGVINVGSKNTSACVFLPDGTKDIRSRMVTGGVIDLAKEISLDTQFLTQLDDDADLALIVWGIETGTYEYGSTGINFEPAFKSCHAAWVKSLRDRLRQKWATRADKLAEIVISGGGAALCAGIASENQRYKIMQDPQLSNVRGMVL